MWYFKTKWIILNKIKTWKEKEIIFVIFSYDYWKILCSFKVSKKDKVLDIWNEINFELETRKWNDISFLKNYSIKTHISYSDKSFDYINEYLSIIWVLNKFLVKWVQFISLYDNFSFINHENISLSQLFLLKMKILSELWFLYYSWKNNLILRLVKFVSLNNINKIFLLKWIDDKLFIELNKLCIKIIKENS